MYGKLFTIWYSLQRKTYLPLQVGGLTSLSLQGLAHYPRLGKEDRILAKGGVYHNTGYQYQRNWLHYDF